MTETPPDVEQLAAEYRRTGDVAARNRVVERCLPVVRKIAARCKAHLVPAVDEADLVQAGVLGVMGAVRTFDPARGRRLMAYAARRVVGAMLDHVREFDPVPRLTRNRTKLLTTAADLFRAEFGRPPDDDELRARVPVTDDAYRHVIRDQAVGFESLARPVFADAGKVKAPTVADVLEDRPGPELGTRMMADEMLRYVLRTQGLRAALTMRLYYVEGWTFKRIADEALNLTESSVSQIHSTALRNARARALAPKRRAA